MIILVWSQKSASLFEICRARGGIALILRKIKNFIATQTNFVNKTEYVVHSSTSFCESIIFTKTGSQSIWWAGISLFLATLVDLKL